MASAFPTTSSLFTELDSNRYDINQLLKALETVREGGQIADSSDSNEDGLFDLHTLTIETTLDPPDQFHHYYNQPHADNPDYTSFTNLRETLRGHIPSFVPLDLLPPSRRLLRLPPPPNNPMTRRDHSLGLGDVFLPTSHARRPVICLPQLIPKGGEEWLPNSKAWDMQNWVQAAMSLDPKLNEKKRRKEVYNDDKERFILKTGLQLCWVSDGEDENAGTEVKLIITVHLFVDLAIAFEPLPPTGHEMRGLILHSLIPAPVAPVTRSDSDARAAGLRYFYDSIKPAADLPFTFDTSRLQPKEMVSRLLPFQTRTLGLLLQRERSPMVGDVKPKISDVAGVWTGVDLGEGHGKIAYRRLTGEAFRLEEDVATSASDSKGKGRTQREENEEIDGLSPAQLSTLPILLDLSGVKGTMLCEEMGLGKTVEAIALVLLNRHPLSTIRNDPALPAHRKTSLDRKGKGKAKSGTPENFRSTNASAAVPTIDLFAGVPGLDKRYLREWVAAEKAAFAGKKAFDEEAQLHVSEVATTLIVTPPSLLRQWVSEMATHSPNLRVCVYEGWKTLQKGILRQHGDSVRAAEARKRKQNEAFRAQTVRKYQKADGRERRVKVEHTPDTDEEDEEDEEKEKNFSGESSLEITQRKFVDYVRAHDVVITTYGDLSQDLKVAFPAPPRSRRSNAKYQLGERPRSPLIMVEWWRVIMDEVQLHGDQTDAANMVSLIPRINSLAVSGTPAKSDIKDLMGSLKFLRVPVLPQDARLWHRFQQPSMRPAFKGLFETLAVRTTKKEVAGEFHLPSQSRFIVPIELSEIELHYYNDALDRQRDLLHLPGDPFRAIRNGLWVLDRGLFRSCLMTLRQICTHIQVGQMQQGHGRGGERFILGRELMTMAEALEKMRSDHVQEFLVESRNQMRIMVKKAQLLLMKEDHRGRYIAAQALYQRVRERLVKQIAQVEEQYKTLVGEHAESVDEDDDTPVRNLSQHERDRRAAMSMASLSIREMSIILHQTWFFEGDVHHALKDATQETECYSQADAVRKEILSRPLQAANRAIEQFPAEIARIKGPKGSQDLLTRDCDSKGGILSDDTITQTNDLLNILNGNAELILAWRKKLIQLLCSPIEAEATEGQDVEDPEKEYYAEVLKAQGEIEAYLTAYAAVVTDRREFILEERSLIQANDDNKAKRKRTTKAARDAAMDIGMNQIPDNLAEQAGTLMAERQAFRDGREIKGCTKPLKALLMNLNGVIHGDYVRQEIEIAKGVAVILKAYIPEQTKHIAGLLKEIEVFRGLFNRRVAYFAVLQEISDSVAVPETKDLGQDIVDCETKINESEIRLTRMTVKGRFLQYLGTKEQGSDELREDCIICMGSSDDTHAVLLECGHFFCDSCFREFRKSTNGRVCPNCRIGINDKAITKVKLAGADNKAEQQAAVEASLEGVSPQEPGPSEIVVEEAVDEAPEEVERKRRLLEMERLREMTVSSRRDIASMDMLGEYGSKINFLIKHLLWYQTKEPTTRHVVFSNWSDSLDIVVHALRLNSIKFMSFESSQSTKRKDVVENFKKDTSYSVFLLHAERESSGLTLTSCRIVHLLEPVLKHSFELQAIGRVDRLGQEKETTVFCYATKDTVESRILAQGVRNGTSIYLKDEDSDAVVASMPNVPSAAHKGGDLSNGGNEEELLGLIL